VDGERLRKEAEEATQRKFEEAERRERELEDVESLRKRG